MSHPSASRVSDSGFEQGDKIGVFAVEYFGDEQQPLQVGGNLLNNEPLTYDGTNWNPSRTLYWGESDVDFYAYYPYGEINSVNALIFDITPDQRTESTDEALGGYESSDFLYAKSEGLAQSDGAVAMQFRHLFTKLNVEIVKGETFEGELPEDITVSIYNTVTTATVDLVKGSATKYAYGEKEIIKARQTSPNEFTAILVPQFIDQLTPLVEVIMDDISYLLDYSISLKPGYQHTLSIIVNTSPDQEKIEISIDGTINDWN